MDIDTERTVSVTRTLFLQQPACSRVPPEILLQIFALVAPNQASLRACILTCRQWNLVGTPVLWRRPQFHHLSSVEQFASTLMAYTSGGGVSHYAKLVETVSFITLPEVDRNNPQLATLLDTIINCMVVPKPLVAPSLGIPAGGWAKHSGCRNLLLPPVIKRSRSLSRNNNSSGCSNSGCDDEDPVTATRPLSATDLQLADGDSTTIEATVAVSTGQRQVELEGETVLERQVATVYTSSLRQLDLRFCKGVRNYSLQRLAPRLASINVLNLAGGLRTDITIAKLSQHMTDLRRISLAWTSNLTDFGVSELVQRCKDIEALDLTYCMQIEDTSMLAIAHNLHSLAALSVAYCAGVTDIGVREVATKFPGLQIVNVAKCLRVTDRMRRQLAQRNIVYACDSFDPFSIYRNKLQPRAKNIQ
ncbi:hypothetical protein H4S07_003987 [Coemansia furcata]|uniref:Uncharacterized protein n=1 Tax=Coemansia furcata TaxID=417177 RepID=A0ACC1LCN9_9FUNG|nr:hypothetical protein H4S07_003987 [Coemansia furcata]